MIDHDEDDTKKMVKHQKIANERMTIAMPILAVSGVFLLITIIVVVVLIMRASQTLNID